MRLISPVANHLSTPAAKKAPVQFQGKHSEAVAKQYKDIRDSLKTRDSMDLDAENEALRNEIQQIQRTKVLNGTQKSGYENFIDQHQTLFEELAKPAPSKRGLLQQTKELLRDTLNMLKS